ncbi:hypothetical protein MNBD_ALPHA07-1014, partial [hydrothermal vent metagenome]
MLSSSQKKRNHKHGHKHGSVRAKVEHVFHVIKCRFGYRRVRDKGLAWNVGQPLSRAQAVDGVARLKSAKLPAKRHARQKIGRQHTLTTAKCS